MNGTIQENAAKRCVMVVMHSTGPRSGRTDQVETSTYLQQHGATQGRKVVKVAWPEEVTKTWAKSTAEIRAILEDNCLRYGGDGCYVTSQTAMIRLSNKITEAVNKANQVADDLVSRMDEFINQARTTRNGLFNRDDYPATKEEFRRSFGVDIRFLPVPENNVLLDMAQDEANLLRESMQKEMREAKEELATRIGNCLSHIIGRLSDPEAKFKNSLIGNLKEIVELVPHLNITGDTAIDQAASAAQSITNVDPDTLREDKTERAKVAEQAKDILNKLRGQ